MINLSIKLAGEMRVVVNRPDGTIHDTGWFNNLILNQGLDRIGSATNTVIGYAQVGTGTSTPVATQVGLDSPVAGSAQQTLPNGGITNSGNPTYNSNISWFFTFAQGAVVGNITEIGVGWASGTGNTLFSRALILDNAGLPTSITVTSIDQLTVYYRLTITPPVTDLTGSVVIGGTSYDYTARVATVGSFCNSSWIFWASQIGQSGSLPYPFSSSTYGAGSVLGSITGSPTLASGTAGTVTPGTYTPGAYQRTDTWNWSTAQGNASGGIQAIVFAYGPQSSMFYQYRFDTVIPKDNTKIMSIVTRITWTRV